MEDAGLKKLVLTNKANNIAQRIDELIKHINDTLLKEISQDGIMYLDALLKK